MGRPFYIRISGFVCVLFGLAVAGDIRLSGQTTAPEVTRFGERARVHETRAESLGALQPPNESARITETETVSPPPPTRSSFMATSERVHGAQGYLLGGASSRSFT